jgi:CheY-like chemotaxis protein
MSPPNATVVLVEDDLNIRAVAVEALTKAGHTVVFEAADAETARNALETLTTTPDVALIDRTFPFSPDGDENGLAGGYVAVAVEDHFPETTIVTFSSGDRFSAQRFPPEGDKSESVIRQSLGAFVTDLPPAARR